MILTVNILHLWGTWLSSSMSQTKSGGIHCKLNVGEVFFVSENYYILSSGITGYAFAFQLNNMISLPAVIS